MTFLQAMLAIAAESAQQHPRGITGIIEDGERKLGATVIPYGSKKPFVISRYDWQPEPVITVRGKEARIVAVAACNPGNGALTRLVGSILRAGLSPAVVEPMGFTMPAILRHWGWASYYEGNGDERYNIWRPSP